jgi:hypothetical protein
MTVLDQIEGMMKEKDNGIKDNVENKLIKRRYCRGLLGEAKPHPEAPGSS